MTPAAATAGHLAPSTVLAYLRQALADAPAATRALVWDPDRLLGGAALEDARGRIWRVLPFSGDRIALLRAWRAREPGVPVLIAAVPPVWARDRVLDLSFTPRIAAELELFVDLRLHRVLDACAPEQGWQAPALDSVAGLVRSRIDRTLHAMGELQALRRLRGVSSALARAAALAAVVPGEPPAAFLPQVVGGAWPVLFDYVRRATDPSLPSDALPLLLALARAQARQPGAVGAAGQRSLLDQALDLEVEELASALLVLGLTAADGAAAASRALDAAFGPNRPPLIALKALRPELVAGLAAAPGFVALLDERVAPRLSEDTLAGSVLGAGSLSPAQIATALQRLPPRTADCLAAAAVRRLGGAGLHPLLHLLAAASGHSQGAEEKRPLLAAKLGQLGAIAVAAEAAPPVGGLRPLVDAWIASGLVDAESRLSGLREQELPRLTPPVASIVAHVIERLRRAVRDRTEEWDQRFAALLAEPGAMAAYHQASFALVTAQHDLRPPALSEDAALFLVVFDGMRLDTWQAVVRPLLEQELEVRREEWRLATLPTYTVISRKAFFAGAQPSEWRGYTGSFTADEQDLVARALKLGAAQRGEDLLFETHASEHPDGTTAPLRRRFNALVYNVCDEEVHSRGGSLAQLQRHIANRVRDEVLPDLSRRVRTGDAIILTSDHGFYAMDREDGEDLSGGRVEEANDVVNYRLVVQPAGDDGLIVDWGSAGRFRLAVGRRWFRRAGGSYTPFSHGGLSLHEAVVPALLLQRVSSPVYRLALSRVGAASAVLEGEPVEIAFVLHNTGTRMLTVRLGTDSVEFAVEPATCPMPPGERVTATLRSTDRLRTGEYLVHVAASYQAGNGADADRRETLTVPIAVRPDPRKVEMSTALDEFDAELGIDV